MKRTLGKIALAGVLVASVLTANVKPAEAQVGVWLGRAAWVGVGAVGYHLWQRYQYGPPRYWSRGYYGSPYSPRYAYGGYYGPPRGYYNYW